MRLRDDAPRVYLVMQSTYGFCFTLIVMRVPYGYVLGAIAGCLEFIPVVGPLIAAFLIVGVAIGMGYKHLLVLIAFLAVWRVIQDYVNAPRIMGRQVELHPLASLFGVLAGAEVAGVIGVYLSIPVMATLRVLWRRWRAQTTAQSAAGPIEPRRLSQWRPEQAAD